MIFSCFHSDLTQGLKIHIEEICKCKCKWTSPAVPQVFGTLLRHYAVRTHYQYGTACHAVVMHVLWPEGFLPHLPNSSFYHNHHPYVCLIGSLQNWYKKVSFVIAREIFFIVLLRWGFSVSCCSHRSHPVSFNYQWDRLDECSGCTGLNWP